MIKRHTAYCCTLFYTPPPLRIFSIQSLPPAITLPLRSSRPQTVLFWISQPFLCQLNLPPLLFNVGRWDRDICLLSHPPTLTTTSRSDDGFDVNPIHESTRKNHLSTTKIKFLRIGIRVTNVKIFEYVCLTLMPFYSTKRRGRRKNWIVKNLK